MYGMDAWVRDGLGFNKEDATTRLVVKAQACSVYSSSIFDYSPACCSPWMKCPWSLAQRRVFPAALAGAHERLSNSGRDIDIETRPHRGINSTLYLLFWTDSKTHVDKYYPQKRVRPLMTCPIFLENPCLAVALGLVGKGFVCCLD